MCSSIDFKKIFPLIHVFSMNIFSFMSIRIISLYDIIALCFYLSQQTESVKQEEKKKEEKDINKIGTLQFSSVKVNLYEDANVGKLSKMQPVSQSSKGVPNMKVKTIAFRAFSTISESQELVLSDSRSHGVKVIGCLCAWSVHGGLLT